MPIYVGCSLCHVCSFLIPLYQLRSRSNRVVGGLRAEGNRCPAYDSAFHSKLDQAGPSWTKLDQAGPSWTSWTKLDQAGPSWTNKTLSEARIDIVEQLRKLHAAAERAQRNDPQGFESNANVKLFRALSQLMLEIVPSDPARDEYRQGNTLGATHRHWRRAKIGRRFRLFFRYDSRSKTIVFAWVNDEQTLSQDSKKSPRSNSPV